MDDPTLAGFAALVGLFADRLADRSTVRGTNRRIRKRRAAGGDKGKGYLV